MQICWGIIFMSSKLCQTHLYLLRWFHNLSWYIKLSTGGHIAVLFSVLANPCYSLYLCESSVVHHVGFQSCAVVFLARSITGNLRWDWGHPDWKYICPWMHYLVVSCSQCYMYAQFVVLTYGDTMSYGKRLRHPEQLASCVTYIIQYMTVRQ